MYKVYTPNDLDSYYEFTFFHDAREKAKELNTVVLDRNNKEVKTFRIERKQVHFEYFEIEASSEEEAISRIEMWSKKPVYDCWSEEYQYQSEVI